MPRLLGISDDRHTCDCCSKSGLKRTVALSFEGEVKYYGTGCAAIALGPTCQLKKVLKGLRPQPGLTAPGSAHKTGPSGGLRLPLRG